MEWDPRGHVRHVVPEVSKILRVRNRAQEDRFQNSGRLRIYREAQIDIPVPLFIPGKSAWPRLRLKVRGQGFASQPSYLSRAKVPGQGFSQIIWKLGDPITIRIID